MHPHQASVRAVINRIIQRIIDDGTEATPSHINPPMDANIEDYGGYGDALADQRPDFLKEAHQGWQTMYYVERD